MVNRTLMPAIACIRLLAEGYMRVGRFSLEGILFTKAQIADRANRFFYSADRPISPSDVGRAVVGGSPYMGPAYFVPGALWGPDYVEFVRLGTPSEIPELASIENLVLEASPMVGPFIPGRFGISPNERTRRFLNAYFNYVDHLPVARAGFGPAGSA